MKNFPTEVRDEFYRENFVSFDAVYLGIPDANGNITEESVLRLCNGGMDIQLPDGGGTLRTYTAQGDFINFSTVTEEFDVKLGKFSIYLSGLSSGMVNRFINRDIEGKTVQIAKVFFDYQLDMEIIGAHIIFAGTIYNVSIVESAKTCTITIDCSTLWADFERTAGRMTNNNSNWLFQKGVSTDTSFEKTGAVGNVEFKWGRN